MENSVVLRGGGYQAVIDLDRGANCVSLRNEQYRARILREPKAGQAPDHPFLYGMPVLFPVNRISGGRFLFEDREYIFPVNEPDAGCHLHGQLHGMPFAAAQKGPDFVNCVFEGQYMDFPHRFRMEIRYELSQEGMRQTTRILNLSGENMPVFLGFHTTFFVRFLEDAKVENIRVFAHVGQEIQRNMANYLPTGQILPPDGITRDLQNGAYAPAGKALSRHYRAEGSGVMGLVDTESGIRLMYENDTAFPWRLIYTADGDAYICMEPMSCVVNCPNGPFGRAESGFTVIPPGQTREYTSRIYLQESNV